MQLQNLAALAAAASAAQNTPSGTTALNSSNSPLSVLTSSGKMTVSLENSVEQVAYFQKLSGDISFFTPSPFSFPHP